MTSSDYYRDYAICGIIAACTFSCSEVRRATAQKTQEQPAVSTSFRHELLSGKIRCAEIGHQYYDRANPVREKGIRPLDPEFAYNEKLNTCLYAGGYVGTSDGLENKFILDLLTNKTLSQYFVPIDRRKWSKQDTQNVAKYDLRKEELFGE